MAPDRGGPTTVVGPFEVELQQLGAPDSGEGSTLGRMSIAKHFHGPLEAVSRGEMLSAMTPVEGSAGYVAFERVTGTLDGRRGTFVLQHSGVMDRGRPQLTIHVVPDSGTGELKGLLGSMQIQMESGRHSYEFKYEIRSSE